MRVPTPFVFSTKLFCCLNSSTLGVTLFAYCLLISFLENPNKDELKMRSQKDISPICYYYYLSKGDFSKSTSPFSGMWIP